MEDLLKTLITDWDKVWVTITTIVGSAALILAGLQKLFGLKPESKWNKKLTILVNLLDRLALNPDSSNARPCKESEDEKDSGKTS